MKISGNITKISDTQFTFTPSSDLDINTKYKMVVKSDFRAEDGITLNEDFKSYFTTINNNPLAIVSTLPLDEATEVSINDNIEVTFNNEIDESTMTSENIWIEEVISDFTLKLETNRDRTDIAYISMPTEIIEDLNGEANVTILLKASNMWSITYKMPFWYNGDDCILGFFRYRDSENHADYKENTLDDEPYSSETRINLSHTNSYPTAIVRTLTETTIYSGGTSVDVLTHPNSNSFGPYGGSSAAFKLLNLENGHFTSGGYLKMSDFVIIKKELTSEEVASYYNGTLDVDSMPELHCHYDFNEGAGTVISDKSGTYGDGNIVTDTGIYEWIDNNEA